MAVKRYGSADSQDRANSNPVISRVPAKFRKMPVNAGQSTQQNIRSSENNAKGIDFVNGAQMIIDEDKQAELDAQKALEQIGNDFGLSINGLGSGYGGSGGSGVSASDRLARDKFEYDNSTALGKYQGLLDYANNASYKPGFDALRSLLDDQNTSGTKAINDSYTTRMGQIADILRTGNTGVEDIYNTGIKNIGAGYDTASKMTSGAYDSLDEFLKNNQTNAYENYQSSYTPSQNATSSYLDAYGVSNDPVNQQVQAENISGQQGADSYAALNKILSGITQQSNLSRLAEAKLGRTGATTALSSQRAGYESNANTVRQNALQELLKTSQTQGFDAGNSQQDALTNLLTAINSGNFDIAQAQNSAATGAEQAALAAYAPPLPVKKAAKPKTVKKKK